MDELPQSSVMQMVTGFFFNGLKDSVILIKKDGHRLAWQKNLWNGVGGKVEHGETPVEAMVREFEEETGINTTTENWTEITALVGDDWKCTFFYHINIHIDLGELLEKSDVIHEQPRDNARREIVHAHNVRAAIYDLPMIKNLHWLIPLALDEGVVKPLGEWTDRVPGRIVPA